MAAAWEITGVDRLISKLQARARIARTERRIDGVVGYTANYAVYVHENLQVRHPTGQAKFLEQPLREHRGDLMAIIRKAYAATHVLTQAILLACLQLQRWSQELVPVDTGLLRSSAFSRVDKG